MTFLPIVERELRLAARRPGTHRLRFGIALATMILGFVVLMAAPASAPPHQLGRNLFIVEGIIAFGFCLLSGVFLTADCLSVEKREGTLGLLFLTDLKGFDVVLGKLAATSLHALYALLAVLPMLGLPLLAGGVSGAEFARLILVVVTTLMFSLTTGLLVSAMSQDTRQTMLLTLGILVVLAGVLPTLGWLDRLLFNKGVMAKAWLLPSPVGALMASFDSAYQTSRGWLFWVSLSILWGLCFLMFGLASHVLPRARLQHTPRRDDETIPLRPRLNRFSRRGELNGNPIEWLFGRDRAAGVLARWTVGATGFLWFCFFIGSLAASGSGRRNGFFAVSFLVAFALHQLFKTSVAIEASRRFCEDRRSGALELLLIAPVPHQLIVAAQWRALRHYLTRPMMTVLLVNVLFLWLVDFTDWSGVVGPERRTFSTIFIAGMVLLVLDFHALSWVGMWMGARGARHHRAVLATLGRIMLPPWIGLLCFVLIGVAGRGMSSDTAEALVVLWLLFGLALSFVLGVTARKQLIRDFRWLVSGDHPPGMKISPPVLPRFMPVVSATPESAS